MKLTPLNILRFWKTLMFPPGDNTSYFLGRFKLKTELPWEPWIHAAVWTGVLVTLVTGELGLYPPGGNEDWVWLTFGLLSSPVGFFSQWALNYAGGRGRYIALWTRMLADVGLAVTILAYLISQWKGEDIRLHMMSSVILIFSAWFVLTIVVRDIRFIILTEQIGNYIYRFGCPPGGESPERR